MYLERRGLPGSRLSDDQLLTTTSCPDLDIDRAKLHLAARFSGLLRFIQELAAKNITITKFYATSVTPTGIAILKNAGFQDIGHIGKRIAFALDTMTSDARLAKQYRMMLRKGFEVGYLPE